MNVKMSEIDQVGKKEGLLGRREGAGHKMGRRERRSSLSFT